MRYSPPENITEEEILNILRSNVSSPSERIDAVLSAILHSRSVEFAGDVLIKEFSEARYDERKYLKNLFDTFYQKNRTNYRIDEGISLLKSYKDEFPEIAGEIEDSINDLMDYRVIFSKP